MASGSKRKGLYGNSKYYESWSEDKSEVYKPHYKVVFPGKRSVYCNKHDFGLVSCHAKEISEGTRSTINYENPPYKVTFPGHDLGLTKDPRLGFAAAKRKYVFDRNGINNDSDYSVSDDDSSEDEEEYNKLDEEEISKLNLEEVHKLEDEEHSGDEIVLIMNPGEQSDTSDSGDDSTPSPKRRSFRNEAREEKRFKQGLRQRYNHAVANEALFLKNRDCKCAETAMKFYNEKHATDYEIVETLGSYLRICAGVWSHCNFKARLKSDVDGGLPSEPKLFFAELYRKRSITLLVNVCTILDGPAPRPDIVRGCKMCPGHLWHPVDGFKVGKK